MSAESNSGDQPSPTEVKLSPVEGFKSTSQFLRGEIPEELVDGQDHFGKGSVQILKHHGTYQQDDRDQRSQAKKEGKGKAYMLMVRTRLPGGKLTSEQMLEELDLCDDLGNQTIRITSRQGLQLHGILKGDLKSTIQRINQCGLTTLGACGDVNRNVMSCPAPYADEVHQGMQQLAETLADHLAPKSSSYRDIWLKDMQTEEKELVAGGPAHEVEPIYGQTYLPRKFKIGIALPEDNCIDIHTHDLGLLVIAEAGQIVGYNVLVGGGLGVTPSAKKTFPALSKPLCFATPDQVLDIVTNVVKVQRDFGNRSDRKIARLKYLIADWGVEKFGAKVGEYYGRELTPPRDIQVQQQLDHLGWDEQGDGLKFYGLNVENGRIADTDKMQLKSAVREICSTLKPGIHLTAHQSMIFSNIRPEDADKLIEILNRHNVPLSESISNTRRWSMACVAWPTCGLSITEAERALPGLIDQLESELDSMGLAEEKFNLRMTGCPNGCARPYNPDIGLVGKTKGKYTLFLGGRQEGDRLNFIYKDLVPEGEVVAELVRVFEVFKDGREAGESFGDFCNRQGKDALLAATGSEA